MAKYNSEELLQSLHTDVERIAAAGRFFKEVDKNKMIYTASAEKWSAVQVLEHLNAYGRYYLPAMERAMTEKVTGRAPWFQSGFWGDYFTKSMKPTNIYEVKNKMKAMKAYSFANSLNVDTVVNEFLRQQEELLRLIGMAKHVDLGDIKVPITLTKLIKLKLGDTLRFLVAHEQRHMIQARNTLKGLGIATDRFPVIVEMSQLKGALAAS